MYFYTQLPINPLTHFEMYNFGRATRLASASTCGSRYHSLPCQCQCMRIANSTPVTPVLNRLWTLKKTYFESLTARVNSSTPSLSISNASPWQNHSLLWWEIHEQVANATEHDVLTKIHRSQARAPTCILAMAAPGFNSKVRTNNPPLLYLRPLHPANLKWGCKLF